jgi:hypothetical protein
MAAVPEESEVTQTSMVLSFSPEAAYLRFNVSGLTSEHDLEQPVEQFL